MDKWIRDKLKYVFDQFKLEGEYGNVMKKRAAILMVKMSESKVKRSYGRWHHITEKSRLVSECKAVSTTFASLNWTVKSIVDNALSDYKSKHLKEKALNQIFKNLHFTLR